MYISLQDSRTKGFRKWADMHQPDASERREPAYDRPEPEQPPVEEPFSDDDERLDPPPLRT